MHVVELARTHSSSPVVSVQQRRVLAGEQLATATCNIICIKCMPQTVSVAVSCKEQLGMERQPAAVGMQPMYAAAVNNEQQSATADSVQQHNAAEYVVKNTMQN